MLINIYFYKVLIMNKQIEVYIKMIFIIFILIGAINWGSVGLFNYNFINKLTSIFGGLGYNIEKTLYVLVGLSAIFLLFRRETYLPMIGEMAISNPSIDYTPEITEPIEYKIENLPKKAKVLYWTSKGLMSSFPNPIDKYADFFTSGVTTVDENGIAILITSKPLQFVDSTKIINTYLHYRYWIGPGLASKIFSIKLNK